jgi:hypothetical protein
LFAVRRGTALFARERFDAEPCTSASAGEEALGS